MYEILSNYSLLNLLSPISSSVVHERFCETDRVQWRYLDEYLTATFEFLTHISYSIHTKLCKCIGYF